MIVKDFMYYGGINGMRLLSKALGREQQGLPGEQEADPFLQSRSVDPESVDVETGRVGVEDKSITVSVIIPTYNEAGSLQETLLSLLNGARSPTSHKDIYKKVNIQVIIADGGSDDGTLEVARTSPFVDGTYDGGGHSRGESLNFGASKADGDLFLFLHADTLVPAGWDVEIRRLLTDPLVPYRIGAFSFKLKEEHRQLSCMSCIAWGTNLRSRYRQLPYGDQGLFMRRQTFHRLGGFPNVPFMEDYDLVKRAQAAGGGVVTSDLSVRTSARRWLINGVVWNTVLNQIVLLGNAVGVPRSVLVRWYYGLTRRKQY